MTDKAASRLHWNYFLALERDLEVVSRYVEFSVANYNTYSIELARLLLGAGSEVDVIAKLLCRQVTRGSKAEDINGYRTLLTHHLPELVDLQIRIPRYGLKLKPWEEWNGNVGNPQWWTSHNNVKHERDKRFREATLQNAIFSVAGLLVLTYLYCRFLVSPSKANLITPKETTGELQPASTLLFGVRQSSDQITGVRN